MESSKVDVKKIKPFLPCWQHEYYQGKLYIQKLVWCGQVIDMYLGKNSLYLNISNSKETKI